MSESERNAAQFDASSDNVFERIAGRYDALCDVFSFGAHRLWKRRLASRIAALPGDRYLDIASGTGDIPLRELSRRREIRRAQPVLVTDLAPAMLEIARRRLAPAGRAASFRVLDAHQLSEIDSDSIDIYSISFAMKILDRARVLEEAFRVLKPGGRFFCLEAGRIPVAPIQTAYLGYMDWCVPLISRLATGGDASAYEYLLRGVHDFPAQDAFCAEIREHGFVDVSHENLTLGIVAIHEARKPHP